MFRDNVGDDLNRLLETFAARGKPEAKVLGNAEAIAGNEHHTDRRGGLAERP